MKPRTLILSLLLALTISIGSAVAQEVLKSPNGNLTLTFHLGSKGEPMYRLDYGDKPVVRDSHLGFFLKDHEDGDLVSAFEQQGDAVRSTFDETWTPVWGEVSTIRNHYNEMLIRLRQRENGREMDLRFRLFDDGIGLRYEFPDQDRLIYFTVKEEATEFAMAGDHTAF